MKKTLLGCLAVAVTLAYGSDVDMKAVKKGQSVYLKKCKKCHGTGTKGAAMLTQDEWEEMFDDGGELIIEKHADTKAAKQFKSKYFKKAAPSLKAFLYHYGADSGNVPSCG